MKSKPFLVAIAAFAVTATGVQAFGNTQMLERAGLSGKQIHAFEIAREKREAGDFDGARDTLVEAGVDEKVLQSVHQIARASREAMHQALEAGDYEAFKTAVEGTPLAEDIDSQEDFEKLTEAHQLKEDGMWGEAKVIWGELGIEPPRHGGMKMGQIFQNLSDDQKEALQVARQANDKEAVKAILKEAGIEVQERMQR